MGVFVINESILQVFDNFFLLQIERHQKESHIGCQANKNTALLILVIVSSVTDGQVGEGLVSHILLLVVSIISGQ